MQDLAYKKAFVLHTRAFKENQVIADLLVQHEGRCAVVGYKGSKKNSAKTALYQPFRLLEVQVKPGKGLHNLKSIDALNSEFYLTGTRLFCGFYLNELVCRLCQADAPFETLFNHYHRALKQLAEAQQITDTSLQNIAIELVLRQFEDVLLTMLGYELNFDITSDTELPIEPGLFYELFDGGFVHTRYAQRGLLGEDILGVRAILRDAYQSDDIPAVEKLHYLKCAKLILRASLHRHLGDKPLKSRELFRK